MSAPRQSTLSTWFSNKPVQAEKAKSKREQDRVYDQNKRKREFKESWQIGRPWLKYDESKGIMFCDVCRKNTHKRADPDAQFVTGSSSMQLTSVTRHENSEKHRREMSAVEAATTSIEESTAFKTLSQLNAREMDKLKIKFMTVHAMVKHFRPFTDFVWMNKLDHLKGLDVGKEYESDKSAAVFAKHIAEVERARVMKEISAAMFAGIVVDGSTDASIQEQQMVYVCACKEGRQMIHFLGCISTPKADADGIVKSIESAVQLGLDVTLIEFGKKLVAIGTDGAAVMTGCRGGVVAKLRQSVAPTIVGIHCFAHRLELAIHDVIKLHNTYSTFDKLLLDLWLFYKNSALNRSNLREACQAAGVKFLVPTRVGGTRWLPHILRAITNLFKVYPAIVMHLSQVQHNGQSAKAKSEATAYINKLTSRTMVEFGHFLWDVVISLAKLSLILQTRNRVVSDVLDHLDGQIAVLQRYAEQDGPKLRQVHGKDMFSGVQLTDGQGRRKGQGEVTVESVKGTLCTDLVNKLTQRFDMGDDLIAATSLANMKTWPEHFEKDFGNKQVEVLVSHFRQNLQNAEVDVESIMDEWAQLKTVLYKRNLHTTISWVSVNSRYSTLSPNFLKLIDLVMTMPASSTEAERGFSTMKLIKTNLRASMKSETLNDLLRIVLLSPSESEYDPTAAVEHWYAARARRMRSAGAQVSIEEEASDEEEDVADLVDLLSQSAE